MLKIINFSKYGNMFKIYINILKIFIDDNKNIINLLNK